MWLEDRGGVGLTRLDYVANELVREANAEGIFRSVNTTFRAGVPSVFADVDRVKAMSLKVPLQSVFDTLQAYLGSTYVNDFNEFGRTWQVMVQADSRYRAKPEDIAKLQVRNLDQHMVPLGTLVKVEQKLSPLRIDRYNMFPAIRVFGEPAAGVSSGQALQAMETVAGDTLLPGTKYEWTAIAYQQ